MVLALYPKAKCTKNWLKGGNYTVTLGEEALDFNRKLVSEFHTGTSNPADAWFYVCVELKII